jgi:glycosyltransferase involved in cell wall biosynthesis
VIIPVRDGVRYLAEAVNSVLDQDVAVHQVLIVDDGSSDGSQAVAESFGAPVEVLRRDPGGSAPAARNLGLDHATGDVIGFLDADDVWLPGSLRRRLEVLMSGDTDLVFGYVEEFRSPELDDTQRASLPEPRGVVPGRVITTLLARRDVFERVGEFDESLQAMDFLDWLARARSQGVTETMTDDLVSRRRVHLHNTQWTTRRGDLLSVLRTSVRRQAGGAS